MKQSLLSLAAAAVVCAAMFFLVVGERPEPSSRPDVSKQKPSGKMSGAMAALEFWTASRAYPNNDIPDATYYKSFLTAQATMKEAAAAVASSSTWEPIGPWNVPGRMISVAINPKRTTTIYAGSASGGLWRSFTGGTGGDWHRVRTGYPVLGVMAIAIDPVDTARMYIGTGEMYRYQGSMGGFVERTTRGSYGIGVLKTTDGGATWTKTLDWQANQVRGVQALRLNPKNRNTIFAGTTEGTYKSMDAGATWRQVHEVRMAQDIIIHAVDTMQMLVSCGNLGSVGTGLYFSLDAGESWIAGGAGLPAYSGKMLMDAYAGDPNVVFASVADSLRGEGIYRSGDFGMRWELVQSQSIDIPSYQGWYSHFVAVHPNDEQLVVAAGVGMFKSGDGGRTYPIPSETHPDHHNYAHDPVNPDILYVVDDGGVWRSTDFGDSFESLNYGLQTAQFYNGFSNSATDSLLAMGGLQDNNTTIYHGSRDGWQLAIGGDGCWTAISPLNDNIMYGESQYNFIMRSTNRGRSFYTATLGMDSDYGAAFVAPFVLAPSNPSIMYSGRSVVFKSEDGAGYWEPTNGGFALDGNSVLSLAVAATNPYLVYAATAPGWSRAHLFRSDNGGITWEDVTRQLPNRYPMDLAVDPQDAATVYVVFGGFGSGHVYKSTDAGGSWTNITRALPDVPTLAIVVDPLNSDHLYVGNDLSVYSSTNGGLSWSAFSDGLPEAVIAMDLSISPSNRKLRVATHGNGVYERALLAPTTGVAEDGAPAEEPSTYALHQNYPNPFNPVTHLQFTIVNLQLVTLKVYNILGEEVATLVDKEMGAGSYTIEWDASSLPSGMYVARLAVGGVFSESRKILLMR